MTGEDLALLRRCRLFREMDERTLSLLLTRFPCRLRGFSPGELIHSRGEAYLSLLVLLRGSVSAEMHDPAGKALHVETIQAPEAIASGILFAPENRLPVSIYAAQAVRLAALSRSAVLECCQRDRGFLEALLQDMGGRAAFLAEKLWLSRFSSLRQKLASYLLERCDRAAADAVVLSATRQELADVFGAARPSVSRVFGELEGRRLISRHGRRIDILDRPALEALRDEDPRPD